MTGDRSYGALLAVPGLGRVLVAMVAGRVAGAMLAIALVLFALEQYSPSVAGVAAALSLVPGLVGAPFVGALLDRWGRVRLIRLDYLVSAAALVLISALSFASALPAALLLAIVAVFGLTQMFSDSGLRSLFPRLVPKELWERANAADSTGYLVAWIVGPPLAATLVSVLGGEVTFLIIAAVFGAAAAVLQRSAGPGCRRGCGTVVWSTKHERAFATSGETARCVGSACRSAVTNVSWGIGLIIVPVIIVDQLSAPEPLVGLAFTVSGVVGVASAVLFGRMDTRGREWRLLVFAMTGVGLAAVLLLPAAYASTLGVGVAWVLASMALLGLSSGLWDIALFTMRQRRTDPVLMGRAFAISMALNQTGVPIGAALAGRLASVSVDLVIAVSVGAGLLGAVLAAVLVPVHDPHEAGWAHVLVVDNTIGAGEEGLMTSGQRSLPHPRRQTRTTQRQPPTPRQKTPDIDEVPGHLLTMSRDFTRVETRGIEPLTPALQRRCSAN